MRRRARRLTGRRRSRVGGARADGLRDRRGARDRLGRHADRPRAGGRGAAADHVRRVRGKGARAADAAADLPRRQPVGGERGAAAARRGVGADVVRRQPLPEASARHERLRGRRGAAADDRADHGADGRRHRPDHRPLRPEAPLVVGLSLLAVGSACSGSSTRTAATRSTSSAHRWWPRRACRWPTSRR